MDTLCDILQSNLNIIEEAIGISRNDVAIRVNNTDQNLSRRLDDIYHLIVTTTKTIEIIQEENSGLRLEIQKVRNQVEALQDGITCANIETRLEDDEEPGTWVEYYDPIYNQVPSSRSNRRHPTNTPLNRDDQSVQADDGRDDRTLSDPLRAPVYQAQHYHTPLAREARDDETTAPPALRLNPRRPSEQPRQRQTERAQPQQSSNFAGTGRRLHSFRRQG